MEHKIFIIKFGRNKVYPINQNKYGMKKYSQNIYLLVIENEQIGDELKDSVSLW